MGDYPPTNYQPVKAFDSPEGWGSQVVRLVSEATTILK